MDGNACQPQPESCASLVRYIRAFDMIVWTHHKFLYVVFCVALAHERIYTMRIEGCQLQEYTMTDLEARANDKYLRYLDEIGGDGLSTISLGGSWQGAPLVVRTFR